jgi:predicted nucleic acid-binding protein
MTLSMVLATLTAFATILGNNGCSKSYIHAISCRYGHPRGRVAQQSRGNPCIDAIGNDWAITAMTALELISGAKNQREVELIDRLTAAYTTVPVERSIGERAYELLKKHAKSNA